MNAEVADKLQAERCLKVEMIDIEKNNATKEEGRS
jgi:hypothetical protein